MVDKHIRWDCECGRGLEIIFWQTDEFEGTAAWSVNIWHGTHKIGHLPLDTDKAVTFLFVDIVLEKIDRWIKNNPQCGYTDEDMRTW